MRDNDVRDRQDLIAGLNDDLAGEYRTIMDYATVIALLRVEVANRQGHARILADTIVALGGKPSETPRPMPLTCDPYELLEQIRRAESASIARARGMMARTGHHGDSRQRQRMTEPGRVQSAHRQATTTILNPVA
jgi:bacterioferritin